ncbi:HTH domain-containing protein [Halosolutus gelatinilyticus]|uniref:HTH domain-containing protein n=1 Tax=Halosolutus gelatinilyticus TaxID=2931975 RepID=UPI001FF37BD1|nr:HTH domain-containing protein [Halosolutus gelatinilyticus]
MSLGEPAGPPVAIDPDDDLRVECYVRATVPGPIVERVEAVVDRLHRLRERGPIVDYRVTRWPAGRHADVETADRDGPTRNELGAAFERWADRHDHSIEPAFRRAEIPSSPLGFENDGSRERVRVPVVALVLYEHGEGGTTEPNSLVDADALRGVVPYTERPNTDDERTYAVGEWLSAVETRVSGLSAHPSRRDRVAHLERRR